jgi:hypothetical protein
LIINDQGLYLALVEERVVGLLPAVIMVPAVKKVPQEMS